MKSKIRNWNARRIEQRRLKYNFRSTNEGFQFKGIKWQFDKDWEPLTRTLVTKFSEFVPNFVNVGAHYGYYCCLAAQNGMKVTGFEPIDANFSMLRDNLAVNNFLEDSRLFHSAVGDRNYLTKIYGAYSGASLIPEMTSNSDLYQITPVIRLSDIHLEDSPTLFLIDVEGFELSVLAGATSLIENKSRNTWIVEICADNFADFGSQMMEAGYAVYYIGKDKLLKIDKQELETAEIEGNFLFVDLDQDKNQEIVNSYI